MRGRVGEDINEQGRRTVASGVREEEGNIMALICGKKRKKEIGGRNNPTCFCLLL